MSKDHYISATFLANFANNAEQASAKIPRKRQVWCHDKTGQSPDRKNPIDKIAATNGLDGNRGFGKRLASLESRWPDLYKALITGISSSDKDAASEYFLLLFYNNPKKQKQRIDILQKHATPDEKTHIAQLEQKDMHRDVRDLLLQDAMAKAVFDKMKAVLMASNWVLSKNETTVPFVTCDDPIFVADEGWFIPLSKEYLLFISFDSTIGGAGGAAEIDDEKNIKELNKSMLANSARFVYSAEETGYL